MYLPRSSRAVGSVRQLPRSFYKSSHLAFGVARQTRRLQARILDRGLCFAQSARYASSSTSNTSGFGDDGLTEAEFNEAEFNEAEFNELEGFGDADESISELAQAGLTESERIALTDSLANESTSVATSTILETLKENIHFPPHYVQNLIEFIHTSTGIPWWATIVGCTIAIRLTLLPLAIKQAKRVRRLKLVQPHAQKLQARLSMATSTDEKLHYTQAVRKFYNKYDASPYSMLLMPMVQAPVFISFFFALRSSSERFVNCGFDTGGFLWWTDLSISDPTYCLPAFVGLTMLATIRLGQGAMDGSENPTPMNPIMKKVLYCMAFAMIPICTQFPTCVVFYWLTNNLCSVAQILTLQNNAFKQWAGLNINFKVEYNDHDYRFKKPGSLPNQAAQPKITDFSDEELKSIMNKHNRSKIEVSSKKKARRKKRRKKQRQ